MTTCELACGPSFEDACCPPRTRGGGMTLPAIRVEEVCQRDQSPDLTWPFFNKQVCYFCKSTYFLTKKKQRVRGKTRKNKEHRLEQEPRQPGLSQDTSCTIARVQPMRTGAAVYWYELGVWACLRGARPVHTSVLWLAILPASPLGRGGCEPSWEAQPGPTTALRRLRMKGAQSA